MRFQMPDEEWVKTIAGGRKVKFIYQELPEDGAFITAQVAGNEVVYSVLLTKQKNRFSREDAARHFDGELSKRKGPSQYKGHPAQSAILAKKCIRTSSPAENLSPDE